MSNISQDKLDLRIEKTRRALIAALFTLLESQPFGKITVNDICLEALCSRATFYSHFMDKYDLLKFGLAHVRQQIIDANPDRDTVIRGIVEFSYSKPELFRNLLMEDTNHELNAMLSGLFRTDIVAALERQSEQGRKFNMPLEILAVFITGGLASIFIWWIESGYKLSKDEMITYLNTMAEHRDDK